MVDIGGSSLLWVVPPPEGGPGMNTAAEGTIGTKPVSRLPLWSAPVPALASLGDGP